MDKKAIQRRRMERYLIDAAKTIIRDEGVEAVTVRKVADLAGYSYTTMYNYFTDLNELLWYVAADFLDEIIELLENAGQRHPHDGVEALKEGYRAYINYFLENPTIYRFTFFAKLGEPPAKVAEKMSAPVLAQKQIEALAQCAKEGLLQLEDAPVVGGLITTFVHGLLLFYFSERMQVKENELISRMEQTIDYLIHK
ncbi:TetR/AcrR family transcriptional regulator [Dethiobacter alkaliphilus]|uniref:TetR/AcrR family transcriptional regulator n=1 Tax=Dethiobacter alkaliphilus TaxID=427926 RepID=UPI002227A429|nr:TetR/AcrR family transcriptional regulator [Dethiobacter alkaliphilus]MCW3489702.1 TetR/AcrR family transcriptional regulator [Dethiobacter alkaliphilus]